MHDLLIAGHAAGLADDACLRTVLTSGDIAGILHPSGAVVPNASVTLKSNESGATQTRATNQQGAYRFSLLSPGTYTISVSSMGFQATQQQATVTVGQAATANIQLALGSASQTIEVSAGRKQSKRKTLTSPRPSPQQQVGVGQTRVTI